MSNGDKTEKKEETASAGRQVTTARSNPPADGDFNLPPALQTLIELERERIESANRRTDVVRYAIETNDASDKRQFDYRMAELTVNRSSAERRHSLARQIVFSVGTVAVVIIALLFGMAFFGAPEQSAVAIEILKVSGIGVAGYGLLGAIVRAASEMFKDKK